MAHAAVVVAFLLAVVLSWATAVAAWRRRRHTPAARALAATLLCTGAWSLGDALLLLGDRVPQLVVLAAVFVAVHGTVAGLHCFGRGVLDRCWRLPRRTAVRFAAAAGLMAAATLTNPWHQLVVTSAQAPDGPLLGDHLGPLFWIHTTYCYAVLAVTSHRLARAGRGTPAVFRRQLRTLHLGAVVPFAGNVLVLAFHEQLGGTDYTPLFFVLTGLLDFRAVFRQGLLEIVPVARARVVDTIGDAVLVFDPLGRIVDLNDAARELVGRLRPDLPADLLGVPARTVFAAAVVDALAHGEPRCVLQARPGLHLDARLSVLSGRRGDVLARVVVVRDISDLVVAAERLQAQLSVIERLQDRLREESVRDALTGLHNRRHVVDVLEPALLRAGGEPVAVVLVDVDHFKAVNDTHGHAAGDEVLRRVAHELAAGVREGDVVARYGGEEFLLLLPGTDLDTAVQRAELLRRRCADLRVPLPRPIAPAQGGAPPAEVTQVRVTVCAGVAVHRLHGCDARTLIAAADAALYAAKRGGRDRVVVAPTPGSA